MLHADAASNYDELYLQNPRIQDVACWAHARHKFYEIAPARVLAHDAVEKINRLFAIERQAREDRLTPQEIRKRREQLAKPIIDDQDLVGEAPAELAPSAPTARAMNYLLNRWDAFARYLTVLLRRLGHVEELATCVGQASDLEDLGLLPIQLIVVAGRIGLQIAAPTGQKTSNVLALFVLGELTHGDLLRTFGGN